jgi:DNA-binding transcriptional LysR family regulator
MLTSDDLRFFGTVADATSLALAARDLNVTPPAVTQRLRALEARLGVHLVHRGPRHITLTDEGELLAERGRAVLHALGDLNETLAERRGHVAGQLRVIAPFGFGRSHVAPLVARFQQAHPEVRVDLTLSDRLSGVPAGLWDLAVNVGDLEQSAASLVMRHLAPNARFLCASPAYLARRGMPDRPRDLLAHDCIALREDDQDTSLWRLKPLAGGAEQRIRIQPCLTSNDGEVARDWALAGRGIVMRSEWSVARDLRAGRLVRLLANHALPPAPIVAFLGARRAARAARTSRFLDLLVQAFAAPPWHG